MKRPRPRATHSNGAVSWRGSSPRWPRLARGAARSWCSKGRPGSARRLCSRRRERRRQRRNARSPFAGNRLERDFAFGVVRQLFEPPLVDAAEDERADLLHGAAVVAAGLLGLPAHHPRAGSPSLRFDPSFAILHGLYWLCANLAAVEPLCLLVDDAHWADAASLRYLAFLLTRLEELDVTLVVAIRPREAATDAELLTTVTTDRHRVCSNSLRDESRRCRAPGGGTRWDSRSRPRRHVPARDARDAFLLRELVEAVSGGIGSAVRAVGRSVRLRLRRLPEHAGRLARALAILEEGNLLQAARLAGLDELEAAAAADLLADRGDPRARPAADVRASHRPQRDLFELSSAERAQGHRRAAELLAEQPGASARVASTC